MIRCIAVDDSPLALSLLEDYINRVDFLALEHKFTSAVEAAKTLRKGNYDLVFLDIQMPDFSGLDLARNIGPKTKLIFTTAYPDFALEGFDLDAVDYLLKPFSFERFMKAVNKAAAQLHNERTATAAGVVSEDRFIFVRSGYETVKIFLKDISYIEAMKDYIQVFTPGKKIISLMSMKEILALLPQDEFVRVHRSYIVPLSKVTRVSSRKVVVEDKEIPLGEVFRASFMEMMSKRIS